MGNVRQYAAEIALVIATMVVAVLGFWSLYVGDGARAQPHHHLHVLTTFLWMGVLLVQLVFLSNADRRSHRRLGLSVLALGPALVASTAMLTVHSAHRALEAGEPDVLLMQNVVGTAWLALVLVLAFALRKRRKVHGALIGSTLLLFLGPALFFALIAFVPMFRIEGPETFHRFQTAAMTGLGIIVAIALAMFLRDWRHHWPYLFAAASYPVAQSLKGMLAARDLLGPLQRLVATPNQTATLLVAFVVMFGLLAVLVLPNRNARQALPQTG